MRVPRPRAVGTLETDYLVVGAGATGMAFVDTLLTQSSRDIVLVDRRHAPGGHWLDAYPFVRLHQPSAIYGANSTSLGRDRIDADGPNAGYYERAGAAEICAYYDTVLRERMLPTGRVRFLPMNDYADEASEEISTKPWLNCATPTPHTHTHHQEQHCPKTPIDTGRMRLKWPLKKRRSAAIA